MNRRKFLGYTAIGLGAGIGGLTLWNPFKEGRSVSAQAITNNNFVPDVEIALTAQPGEVSIFSGKLTQVQHYTARVLKGPSSVVQTLENTYLGPILRLKTGQNVRVRFTNQIDQETIVHWHGLHVPEQADGHPRYVIDKGETYVYEFTVANRAGTYWFHPHPHGRTGPQVYSGLAGLFIVQDDEEQAANLPTGAYDIPLIIQDRTFDANNQLVYLSGGMMQRMNGFLGNRILVNGQPDPVFKVASNVYRLRLLNGSNSRIYKIAWSDGSPLTIIGTDGGLLEKPLNRPYVMLGPAERIELWADFSNYTPNSSVKLVSLPFDGAGGMGMMGGMMGRRRQGQSLPNGSGFDLARFDIVKKETPALTLPIVLSKIEPVDIRAAVNANNPRTFTFAMGMGSATINGRTFEMTRVASDEVVKLNTSEVWRLVNGGGGGMGMMGGMMQMPHPVHVHGLQFRVLERTPGAGWQSMKDGFVDEGWKDTVLLMPGMQAKILLRFVDFSGLYLYHCHNLEHEDMGMMRNYLIEA
ncbi:multicopper oxidase type 3 [Caldithrix abyssi DSM 13497]|uniref:Multicopper oxidase type 3 n=1 Tax=Caldithrix abyssi DSM 13497 TaxID=880073 RepID=H1XVS0_CALAY|nr:multicopper oxidase domain-containing protein [Caldithrix abyssi]APF20892.1 hypothetical protein Cabys_4147 [Caldithrix abyssi DSM 13497]EHO40647.1 multicopper oxidase type 3 [Caldithrix abyssi DSM 13497]